MDGPSATPCYEQSGRVLLGPWGAGAG